MPSRRACLASLASLGSSAALAGCSSLGGSPGAGGAGGAPAIGEAAVAQRNGVPIPAGRSGDRQLARFSTTTVDYDALASRLSAERRRSQRHWFLEDSPVDDVTSFSSVGAEQVVAGEQYAVDFVVTEGDVDRDAVRSRFGLPEEPRRRHRGFDCYGGPDADLGTADQSVAVSDDVLVAVGAALVSGRTTRVDGLDYAIEVATAAGSADGWIGDAFDAATPAHQVDALYRVQDVDDEDAATVDLSTIRVRDSEVGLTTVHAHEAPSEFQEAFRRRDPASVFGHRNVTRSDVETRDRMAIWRRSQSHEAFFSED